MTSDSDSSDEENLDLLKEAQDPQFINDSMFSDSPEKSSVNRDQKLLPSLRSTEDADQQFNYFLKVTPQFRSYVGKQLSKILDRKLKNKFTDLDIPEVSPKKRKEAGIKLLSESENFLQPDAENLKTESSASAAHNARGKLARNSSKTNKVSEESLREVAVSAQDILSKKEVKHWSTRSKAPVFYYKKKNGQLELIKSDNC